MQKPDTISPLITSYKNTLRQIIDNNTSINDLPREQATIEAIADSILNYDHGDKAAHYIKGNILFNAEKFRDALTHLKKAAPLDNAYEEQARKNLTAQSYYFLEQFAEAIPLLEDTILSHENSQDERIMLSYALLKTGEITKARQHYQFTEKEEFERYFQDEHTALKSKFGPAPAQPTSRTPPFEPQ